MTSCVAATTASSNSSAASNKIRIQQQNNLGQMRLLQHQQQRQQQASQQASQHASQLQEAPASWAPACMCHVPLCPWSSI